MSVLETIRSEMVKAMKGGPSQEVKKTILRQIISEAQRLNVTDDAEVHKVIRKLVEGNTEALSIGGPNPRLDEENAILSSYLPRTLTVPEIRLSLAGVSEEIKGAKSDGQATGVAMKHIKSLGSAVNGKDVALVISEIRGGSNENQLSAS